MHFPSGVKSRTFAVEREILAVPAVIVVLEVRYQSLSLVCRVRWFGGGIKIEDWDRV